MLEEPAFACHRRCEANFELDGGSFCGLVHKREFRGAAAEALDIPLADIQHNLVVEQSSARHFQLTPICVPDDPPAKCAKRSREPDHPAHDVGMVSGDAKVELESSTDSVATIRKIIGVHMGCNWRANSWHFSQWKINFSEHTVAGPDLHFRS